MDRGLHILAGIAAALLLVAGGGASASGEGRGSGSAGEHAWSQLAVAPGEPILFELEIRDPQGRRIRPQWLGEASGRSWVQLPGRALGLAADLRISVDPMIAVGGLDLALSLDPVGPGQGERARLRLPLSERVVLPIQVPGRPDLRLALTARPVYDHGSERVAERRPQGAEGPLRAPKEA